MAIKLRSFRSVLYAAWVAAAVAALAACASRPPSTAAPAHATSIAASGGTSANRQEKAAPTSHLLAQVKLVHRAWQEGLPVRIGIHNGVTYYCWSSNDIGSLIPSTKCVTGSQLRAMLDARRRMRVGEANMHPLQCGGNKLCGGGN